MKSVCSLKEKSNHTDSLWPFPLHAHYIICFTPRPGSTSFCKISQSPWIQGTIWASLNEANEPLSGSSEAPTTARWESLAQSFSVRLTVPITAHFPLPSVWLLKVDRHGEIYVCAFVLKWFFAGWFKLDEWFHVMVGFLFRFFLMTNRF